MRIEETMRGPELAAGMSCKTQQIAVFQKSIAHAHGVSVLWGPDVERAAIKFIGLLRTEAFWPVIFSGEAVSHDRMNRSRCHRRNVPEGIYCLRAP